MLGINNMRTVLPLIDGVTWAALCDVPHAEYQSFPPPPAPACRGASSTRTTANRQARTFDLIVLSSLWCQPAGLLRHTDPSCARGSGKQDIRSPLQAVRNPEEKSDFAHVSAIKQK
jgi:hypothetical protein